MKTFLKSKTWEKVIILKERTVEVTGEGHRDSIRVTPACESLNPQLVCRWPRDWAPAPIGP